MGTLYRIVNEPPPPMTRAGWLEPLVQHLMVHDPDQRWSAEQVAAYLEDGAAHGACLHPQLTRTGSRSPAAQDRLDRPERPGQHPDPEVEDDATASLLAATPEPRAEAPPAPTNEKPVGRGRAPSGIAVWAMIAVAVTAPAASCWWPFRPGWDTPGTTRRPPRDVHAEPVRLVDHLAEPQLPPRPRRASRPSCATTSGRRPRTRSRSSTG